MTTTSVYLVGKDGLLKEGIKILLGKTDFHITGDYDDILDMSKKAVDNGPVPLIISIDDEAGDLAEKITAIKDLYAQSRVVVISARTRMPVIMAAFSAGVDGYILKDISCEGLVGSLKLVASGEKVYPAFMLSALSSQSVGPSAPGVDRDKASNVHHLSRQELKIINCLASGAPNKIIAHNLNIAETTVKAHVKTILRKLGARNRTQAAIWATANGLADDPGLILLQQAS